MSSHTLARRVLAVSSLLLIVAIVVAALLPAQPDGRVTGPLGITTAVVAFIALLGAWVAAIWHAAASPWNAAVPRWVVIVLLVFGTGVGGVLYYILYAHWQRRPMASTERAA
jgi:hypothetical protein